jgi:cystathionine beta-synthase
MKHMKYASSVLDLIGNTPLVKLNSVTEGIDATVLAKLEYLNPGGSVKDRIAAAMIDDAEASGALQPGGTIVEPTSGNTGVGLALVAQLRGYRMVCVTPDKVGAEKLDVLRAYGSRVAVTATAVDAASPESYYGVSDALVREIEGGYKPDQFNNPAAPRAHYETTGPEIWRDTEGRVTHLVAGAATGGTVIGTGRYLKEVSADRRGGPVKVIVSDPEGSIYSGGSGTPYFVEGVGEDMWPGNYDPSLPDEVHAVTDAEAFAMTRRLATEEGLLVGGSSGMAVACALKAAAALPADAVVVVILPDGGRGYLGKIFNDEWMRAQGFAVEAPEALPEVPGIIGGDGVETVGWHAYAPLTDEQYEGERPAHSPRTLEGLVAAVESRPRGRVLSADLTVEEALTRLESDGGGAGVVGPTSLPSAIGSVQAVVTRQQLQRLIVSGHSARSTRLAEIVSGRPWDLEPVVFGSGQTAAEVGLGHQTGGFVLAHNGRAVGAFTVGEALELLA